MLFVPRNVTSWGLEGPQKKISRLAITCHISHKSCYTWSTTDAKRRRCLPCTQWTPSWMRARWNMTHKPLSVHISSPSEQSTQPHAFSLLRQQLYTPPASNAPSHLMSTHQKELKLTKTYAQQRMKLSNILLACSRLWGCKFGVSCTVLNQV